MKNYRPLPSYLTIKDSPIDGQGLFAIKDIESNTLVGITHIYRWEGIMRTPLGGFINHSDKSNCKLVREEKSSESRLLTIEFIKSGEELTLKYEMYEVKK
jgi:SET domain-containing protein